MSRGRSWRTRAGARRRRAPRRWPRLGARWRARRPGPGPGAAAGEHGASSRAAVTQRPERGARSSADPVRPRGFRFPGLAAEVAPPPPERPARPRRSERPPAAARGPATSPAATVPASPPSRSLPTVEWMRTRSLVARPLWWVWAPRPARARRTCPQSLLDERRGFAMCWAQGPAGCSCGSPWGAQE